MQRPDINELKQLVVDIRQKSVRHTQICTDACKTIDKSNGVIPNAIKKPAQVYLPRRSIAGSGFNR